ncbi:MAG: primosomal protein N' [Kiritimatiellae bacterium]|nr:primosomal protein N' [Kiritimatiellia bacterium]
MNVLRTGSLFPEPGGAPEGEVSPGAGTGGSVARVITGLSLDREFDYRIPEGLRGQLRVGHAVRIPFGRRRMEGFVTAIGDHSDYPAELKAIEAISRPHPLFDETMLRLARWMGHYYAAPFETAIAAILPAAVRHEGADFRRLLSARRAGGAAPTPEEEEALRKRSPKAAAAWEALRDGDTLTAAELARATGVSVDSLRRLASRGWIVLEKAAVRRDPAARLEILPTVPPPPTEEQAAALAAIGEEIASPDPGVVLLHGVTGSGKTEVYLSAIQMALDAGKGAIALVPEISLTPQTMERFRGRFGDTVAVLHSQLSDGERHDEWQRIASGKARVALGARSALFAPIRPLGLLVVDEEHEPAYKQDETPHYHARDVAVMRGRLEGCPVLLGSATPSLESYRNARSGKYRLVRLTRRIDRAVMPDIRVVDMRLEAEKKSGQGRPLLSSDLVEAVRQRLARGEQSILFLNRRGFSTAVSCPDCGHEVMCPDCSVHMTYHRSGDFLLCHVCGARRPAPDKCPECGSAEIKRTGTGTQRIEAVAQALFPRARIARMDSDTTRAKDSHQRILGAFRRGDIDILIGTQMIAKGLDFPNVTLVGVVNADASLQVPDFRAAERTFQLLTQVAGRAGRGDVPGEVFFQTSSPFNPALQCACHADMDTFYDQEILMRELMKYPPFTRMTTVLLKGPDPAAVDAAALSVAARLRAMLPPEVELKGPAPAPLAKAKGLARVHLLLFAPAARDYLPALRAIQARPGLPRGTSLTVDVDAHSLM